MIQTYKDFSWIPSNFEVFKEKDVHPHVDEEKSHLFESLDGASTELEVLNWIHSTIRLIKPEKIVETGSFLGLGTLAMSHACSMNGFGKVYSIENSSKALEYAKNLITNFQLDNFVKFIEMESLDYLKSCDEVFDIGFFDSENTIRAKECKICFDKKILKKMAIFHDTSEYRNFGHEEFTKQQNEYRDEIFNLTKNPICKGFFENKLSRGIIALFLDA